MNNFALNLAALQNLPEGDPIAANNIIRATAQDTLDQVYQLGITNGFLAGMMPPRNENADVNPLQDTVRLLIDTLNQQNQLFRQEMTEHRNKTVGMILEVLAFMFQEQEENRDVIKEITQSLINRDRPRPEAIVIPEALLRNGTHRAPLCNYHTRQRNLRTPTTGTRKSARLAQKTGVPTIVRTEIAPNPTTGRKAVPKKKSTSNQRK